MREPCGESLASASEGASTALGEQRGRAAANFNDMVRSLVLLGTAGGLAAGC